MIRYRIPIYVALEQVIPTCAEVVNAVNESMALFGFHEKITLQSPLLFLEITFAEIPTEVTKFREEIKKIINEKLGYEVRVADFNEWAEIPLKVS